MFVILRSLLLSVFCVFAIGPTQANEVENWYWGFNLGGASTHYANASVRSNVKALKENSAIRHQTLAFDVYFAWPVFDQNTLFGIAGGGIIDRYRKKSQSEEFLINSNVSGVSVQRFFGQKIGSGLYGRLDLGLASTQLERTSSLNITRSETEFGIGFRLAAGYSFPLSDQTRLPVSIHWVYSGTGGETGTRSLLFTVGLLF